MRSYNVIIKDIYSIRQCRTNRSYSLTPVDGTQPFNDTKPNNSVNSGLIALEFFPVKGILVMLLTSIYDQDLM